MSSNILTTDFLKIWPVVPGTLLLSAVILLLGILGGAVLNPLQGSHSRLTKLVVRAYVTYFRGIPLLIHLMIFYYGLPLLLTTVVPLFDRGVNAISFQRMSPLYAIILSYGLYTSAFMGEIIRGAYRSVQRGQLEAAQAMGYTKWQSFVHIKLPQALTEALPKFLNYYLLLIRQLSLAFMVSFIDIFAQAQLQSANNYRYIEAYVASAGVYWLLSLALTFIFNKYERYLRRFETSFS